jgi:predicted O-methyltransferase YrrM
MAKKLKDLARKNPFLWVLYNVTRLAKGYQPVFLDYPVQAEPRWGYGKPVHSEIQAILERGRARYAETLRSFLAVKDSLVAIPLNDEPGSTEPCWRNRWLPGGLDTLALYGMLATSRPKQYLEVGSGYSTRLTRRTVRDQKLETTITSIDPQPRAEIDKLCDRVIRQSLQQVDLAVFDELEPGDIVFFDGSHRASMNSDVTVFFLEVLPRLLPGVLVHLHDIALPADYPPEWRDWYYSEQYLLAVALLAEHPNFDVVLPNAFVAADAQLSMIVEPIWREVRMKEVPRQGMSFWMRMK